MTSTEGGRDDEAVCVVEELPLHPVVASADVAPVGGEAGVGEIAVSKSLFQFLRRAALTPLFWLDDVHHWIVGTFGLAPDGERYGWWRRG